MDYSNIKILVLHDTWIGATGLSAFNAFLRTGASAIGLSESNYIPQRWQRWPMRVMSRLLQPMAVQEFNDALLHEATSGKPHLFFTVKGAYVKAETLITMREMGITSFCFYPDVSFMTHGPYLPRALKEYDWIFTTKSFGPKDLRDQLRIENSSVLPHAFDPLVHKPRPVTSTALKTYGCDVSFIGTWSPKKQQILEDLVKRRPAIKLLIWGNQWQRLPVTSPLRDGYTTLLPVVGTAYATAISCSKINLGLLSEVRLGASSGDKITSRTFHIPASGGLMLHERSDEVLQIFKEGESIECFDGIGELVTKIDTLLADPIRRMAIAQHGRDVVVKAHSWDHRVRTILDQYCHNV